MPAPLTALIGRDRELASGSAILRDRRTRLLTLTGAPGTGKTRLALALADLVADAYPDGVWLASLASVPRANLVLATVAQVLRIRQIGPQPLWDAVVDALRDTRILLVLDNFEHLLPAAPLVVDLLAECPAMTVLATSRAPLRVSGERQFPVAPLELPALECLPRPDQLARVPAVQLFAERAQAVQPTFQLCEENALAVTELCVRLDGLPLAIELAAARTAVLEPDELLARIEHRMSVLADGPRDLPRRQRTLRDAIGWSYELLSSDVKRLFRQLGVFAGGCTLEALGAVASEDSGATADVLDGVSALIDWSLLRRTPQPGGGVRVDMLETVREYAVEQLTLCGEVEATRQRHANYYQLAAERVTNPRLDEPDGPLLLDRTELEHNNIRAALRWFVAHAEADQSVRLAGALWSFWEKRGHWVEGVSWLENALSLAGGLDRAARARAQMGSAVLHRCRSQYVAGAQAARESAATLRAIDDQLGLARMLIVLADLVALGGDLGEAAALCSESLELRRQLNIPLGTAWTLLVCGMISAYGGDWAAARAHYQAALEIRNGAVGNELDGNLLTGLGAILAGRGELQPAHDMLCDAVALFRQRGEARGLARALLSLGDLVARSEDPARGRAMLNEALGLFRALGEGTGVVTCSRLLDGEEPQPLASEIGEGPLAKWWRVCLGRDVPPSGQQAVPAQREPPHRMSGPDGLTRREVEIMGLLGLRYSNREIADALLMSVRTVERHVTNIYNKTGIQSRREAAAYSRLHGLQPRD